jgi:VCBS repeat-containing protein
VSDADGLDDVKTVTINGQTINISDLGDNNQITTPAGTLTVTSYNSTTGVATYTYDLQHNTSGDNTSDVFTVTTSDGTATSTPATITIDIVDDKPVANPDVDSVTEDGPLVANGNVLTAGAVANPDANSTDGTADKQGADGAHVVSVSYGSQTENAGTTINGQYGTLTLNADGTYTYTLTHNNDAAVQGLTATEHLTETFNYTIQDGDGDQSSTTLTVTINGSDDGVTIDGLSVQGGELSVNENDLPAGTDAGHDSLTDSGSFTFIAKDGLGSISIGGHDIALNGQTTVVDDATGTLKVTGVTYDAATGTGTVNYSYTLKDNVEHAPGQGTNTFDKSFDVTVTDRDGSHASSSLDVSIVDDTPKTIGAVNATGSLTEASTDINVQLVLDTSGSMGSTGIQALRSAVKELLDRYDGNDDGTVTNNPNVHVSIVLFNTGATTLHSETTGDVWMSLTDAYKLVNNPANSHTWDTQNNTNYQAALSAASDALDIAPAGQTVAYFISDGEPNYGGPGNNGNYSAGLAEWNAHKDDGMTAYSIAIGTQTSDNDLQAIATDSSHVINSSLGNLEVDLGGAVVHVDTISGYIVSDTQGHQNIGTIIGADQEGAHISTFSINGKTYTYNEQTHKLSDGTTTTTLTADSHGNYTATVGGAHGDFGFTVEGPDLGHYSYNSDKTLVAGPEDHVSYTLVDGDGDPVSSTIDFNITGTLTVAATDTTVSETTNLSNAPGAADATGSMGIVANGETVADAKFASGATSSLDALGLKSDGATIHWYLSADGHTLTGATGANASSGAVITIVLDPAHNSYTVALDQPLDHTGANGSSITLPNLPIEVTGSDNPTPVTSSFDVTITDSTPTFSSIDDAIIGHEASTITGTHNLAFGADGEGQINLSMSAMSGVTTNTIHNANGSTTMTGGVGGSSTGFFSLTVNPDGTYAFNLITPNPAVQETVNFGGVSGGSKVSSLAIGSGDDRITFTATAGHTLNPSSQGFGVDNNNLDSGEKFTATFNNASDITIAGFGVSNGNVSVHWVTDTGEVGDVSSVNGVLTVNANEAFHSISFTVTAGSAKMDGFFYGHTILASDETLHFNVSGTDGDGDTTSTVGLNIELQGGGAGDSITGTSSGEILQGTSHAETISGGNGNDVIHGGAGSDTLYGGDSSHSYGDSDTFVWKLGDEGTTAQKAVDTIKDFGTNGNGKGTDMLDLSDLLQGADHNHLENYLNIHMGSGSTSGKVVIDVATGGNVSGGGVNQQIVLDNVSSLSALGITHATNDQHDVINDMIAQGKLKVDQH